MEKTALIAMSGGVDSSVAAYLMAKNDYKLIGATMKLFSNDEIGVREKSCCSLSDVEDARMVAAKLGFPYYVFNFTADFEKTVIKNFIDSYENGLTPNPCIECNRYLKFNKLMARAKELGIEYVVTGHYAIIEKRRNRYLLKKSVDETKDQSYVLYSMTQDELAHTLFPLGNYRKSEVRKIAEKENFINAKKHDSQDICFVPDGKYFDFIKSYTKKEYPSGNFIDKDGNILGTHSGIINYTTGQRKGLGISSKKPLYVISKNTEENTVTLGQNEDLLSSEFYIKNINLIPFDRINGKIRCKVRTRYNMKESPAIAEQLEKDLIKIVFETPQRAITNGQAAVMYDGDYVIGGGTITTL